MNAIITGATKGIGRALCFEFSRKGFDLMISARTEEDLIEFSNALQSEFGNKVHYYAADLSNKIEVLEFCKQVSSTLDNIDVLINNAGVFLPCTILGAKDTIAYDTMMNLNMNATYYITQALLPLMLKAQKGHIFNICSIASIMPYGVYAISKHAMIGFSKVLREELKSKNIRVTAVLPGAVRTDSWAGTDLPEERFMPAEDIAKSIGDVFDLSDRTDVEEILLRPQLGDI